MTISQAMATLKLLDKRIEGEIRDLDAYAVRRDSAADPLVRKGSNSAIYVAARQQAIADMSAQKIAIKEAIALANQATSLTVAVETRTVSQWIVWKRIVAPGMQTMYAGLLTKINRERAALDRENMAVAADSRVQLVVNLDEQKLREDAKHLEDILGELDGQLSIINATTMITLP
jgi:hypothetical protein